jgi:CHAT domain-containing protein
LHSRFGVFFFPALILYLVLCAKNVLAFDAKEPLDVSFTNEQCTLELDDSPRAKGLFIYRIMCSAKEVGLLLPQELQRAREINDRLNCLPKDKALTDGVLKFLNGFDLQACRQKSNNLPYAVMRFQSSGRSWVADGPPAIIPSVIVLANLPSLTQKERQQVIARLPEIWRGPVPLLSGLELHQIKTMLRDARSANQRGDYELAENLHRELLALQTQTMGGENIAVAETLMDLALNVSNLGRFEEAEALFKRAEPMISAQSSAELRARMKGYRCLDAANKGDFPTALAYAKDAVKTWRFMLEDSPKNGGDTALQGWGGRSQNRLTAELTYALHLEAAMLLRNEDGQQAYERAGEAMRLASKVNDFPPDWKAELLMTLGESAMAMNRMAAAEQYFRVAQQIREDLYGPTLPSIKTLVTLGRAFHMEGIDTSAVSAYREAFTRLLNSTGVKSDFLSAVELNDFVAAAFNLISRPGLTQTQKVQILEEVFYTFQMSRSGVADKTIVQSAIALSVSDTQLGKELKKVMDQDRLLLSKRADLADQNMLSDDERDPSVEKKLLSEIQSLEANLKNARDEINLKFPAYSTLATPKPLNIRGMQSLLNPGEALVSFMLGRKESYAILIKKSGLDVIRIPLSESAIKDSVQTLRKGLQPQAGGLGEFEVDEAFDLYKNLIDPFKTNLKDVDHLIINATGALASLPFSVLITKDDPDAGHEITVKTAWLSRSFAISHIPSIQSFAALRKRADQKTAPRAFFGIGNPRLDGSKSKSIGALDQLAGNCKSDAPMPAQMIRALAPLPDTNKEIQSIAKLLDPDTLHPWLLGADATETGVRKMALDQYRILYFATHGLLPGELKCQAEPALVLTPPATTPASKSEDGLLQASEVATLKINADLVVLSACNTAGGGNKLGGEALSGLAESFFYAGARGLVVSHWQVPSEPTARLMTGMFSRVGTQFSTTSAKALSAAQYALSTDEKTAHPYFWAAFTIVGDGGKVIGNGAEDSLASAIFEPAVVTKQN